MDYRIDSMHLNYGHMSPTQFNQIFSSSSCVQQRITPERLNQIYIEAHRWKEEILGFPMMCHARKSARLLVSNFKSRAPIVARPLSKKCARNQYYTIESPFSIDKSTLHIFLPNLTVAVTVMDRAFKQQ